MQNENTNLTAVLERAGLAVKLSIISCVLSAVLSIIILLTGPVYEWAGFATFTLSLIPFTIAFLCALMAWIHSKLTEKAIRDEEEKVILQKRKESKLSILEISEDVRFTAGRNLLNFEKYVPSTVAALMTVILAFVLVYLWKALIFRPEDAVTLATGMPKQPIVLAFLSAMCAAFSLFLGIFLAGQSHVLEFRWLRPVGAWLMAGALVMCFTLISSLLAQFEFQPWDGFFSRFTYFALAVLCAELLLSFISEFYRPRNQMEDRPVYESRLLSLFTEPGGIMRNIADSLDYQFGFKVSRTWIFGFFGRAILPAILLWLLLFWAFTIVTEVAPGEVGIRERFGAVSKNKETLDPGIYFKLPWPFETIRRIPIDKIQEVVVGSRFEKDGKVLKPGVVLWTTAHAESNSPISTGFLVANDMIGAEVASAVSILEITLPINYRVRKDQVYNYAFKFENVQRMVKDVSEQEAARYFASTDFIKDMSSGRETIVQALKTRIQAEADRLGLGIEIDCVNVNDAHPPVKDVAPAFQDVLAAQEQVKTLIYEATAQAEKVEAEGKIKSMEITSNAQAYSYNVSTVAEADAFRFKSQLTAYQAQPKLFRLRTYLDFLEIDCKDLRKYIISANIPSQIFEVNMEENPRLDLLNSGDINELGK